MGRLRRPIASKLARTRGRGRVDGSFQQKADTRAALVVTLIWFLLWAVAYQCRRHTRKPRQPTPRSTDRQPIDAGIAEKAIASGGTIDAPRLFRPAPWNWLQRGRLSCAPRG